MNNWVIIQNQYVWNNEQGFLNYLRRKLPITTGGSGIIVNTVGTNGAATFDGTNLNIPIYSNNPVTYASITGKPTLEQFLGTIYTTSTWADTSAFTNNGSTVSVVANHLQFTGGVNNFTQTLDFSRFTCLEKWKLFATVSVDAKNAGSNGFGLGLRSANVFGNPFICNTMVQFDASTGGNSGKLTIRSGDNTYPYTVTSDLALTFSAGHVIELTFERVYETVYATARNKTIGGTIFLNYTFQYLDNPPYRPNTGKFAIYSVGGQFTVTSLSISSLEVKNAGIALIGDSKASGTGATDFDHRLGTLVNQNYDTSISLGGPGDALPDMLNRLPEIIGLNPKVAVLTALGSNDKRNGVSDVTIAANYDLLASSLIGAGISVVHCTAFPEAALNQSALYSHILATYNPSVIIDTFAALTDADNILQDSYHLNDYGQSIAYKTILNSGVLPQGNWQGIPNNYVVAQNLYPQLGSLWLTGNGTFGGNIVATNSAAIGTSLTVGTTATIASTLIMGGVLTLGYEGYQGAPSLHSSTFLYFIADADISVFRGASAGPNHCAVLQLETVPSFNQSRSGEIRGLNNDIGTVPNAPLYIYTTGFSVATNGIAGDINILTGLIGGGVDYTSQFGNYNINVYPSGTGHVNIKKLLLGAGAAAAGFAPLKLTSGTNLTTAEPGAFEYNGTNLFFTRAGTTREGVLSTPLVSSVSPTAPNRTIQVNIAGTDYFIAAKTTNN